MLGYTTIGEIVACNTAEFLHNIREQSDADSRIDLPQLRALFDSVGADDMNGERLGASMNFYSIRHLTRFRYSRPIQREHYGDADAPALGRAHSIA